MVQAILLTGKRGAGKSISAVRLMDSYLRRGCAVATNMDLYPEKLCGPRSKQVIYRLPDVPKLDDLELLPLGNPNPTDESKNGLLVLDEVATFLNSRDWKQTGRGDVISWFLHSRKFGWDLCFMAQHPRLVDVQIRDGLFEISATARRLDNLQIPFIGQIFKFFGIPFRLPRFHLIIFRYGFASNSPQSDIWCFAGARYHDCYNSLQQISPLNTEASGLYCLLPGWHYKGRYMSWFDRTKGALLASFFIGVLLSCFLFSIYTYFVPPVVASQVQSQIQLLPTIQPVKGVRVIGIVDIGSVRSAVLSNGDIGVVTGESFRIGERLFLVNGQYYLKGQ